MQNQLASVFALINLSGRGCAVIQLVRSALQFMGISSALVALDLSPNSDADTACVLHLRMRSPHRCCESTYTGGMGTAPNIGLQECTGAVMAHPGLRERRGDPNYSRCPWILADSTRSDQGLPSLKHNGEIVQWN